MSDSFHDHFSSFAKRYADFRPNYPAALFDYLATVAPGDLPVWDCAAGNGQASLDLAERFKRVIATDASAEQIAAARPHSRIEYRVALAEQSGLEDHSAGLVTVAQALHWFNHDRFYAEVKRVLRPGGTIAVWCYGINSVEGEAIDALVQDYYWNVVGPYWPPERALLEQGYRTIPFPFQELQTPRFELEARWNLDQLLGYFSSWSATNRYLKATERNPLEALSAAISPLWGDRNSARLVKWPMALRVGRV
jgi:ubiquinone/menaquinone biosynthesis C-methylase UbiE